MQVKLCMPFDVTVDALHAAQNRDGFLPDCDADLAEAVMTMNYAEII